MRERKKEKKKERERGKLYAGATRRRGTLKMEKRERAYKKT